MCPAYIKSKTKVKNDRGKEERYRKVTKIYFFEKNKFARKI
jgi:hypothetical protein